MTVSPSHRLRWLIVFVLVTAATILFSMQFGNDLTVVQRQELCQKELRHRNWEQLQNAAEEWTQVDPESGEAWLYLGSAFEHQKDYARAAESLLQIPATAVEYDGAQLAIVELYFGPLNSPQKGAAVCEEILARNPNSKIAQQRLIFFLAMTLQRTRLLNQIRSAIEAEAEPREAYVYYFFADSLQFTNGDELNARWLTGDPESELFEVARAIYLAETLDAGVNMDDREAALTARKDLAQKEVIMQELLQKYPHNLELLAYHLRQCQLTGNLDLALKLASQAPVEAETDNRFWRFKGWIHAQRSETKESEQAYERALELHPLDWGTRSQLAELHQQKGKVEEVLPLREMVSRANEIRREIQPVPDATQVPHASLLKLAEYAADCGDLPFSNALKKRLQQFHRPQRKETLPANAR